MSNKEIQLNLCDKCKKPVPPENNAVLIQITKEGESFLVFSKPRHFLPTPDCQGSPSRAQYIEGQERDHRGYSYIESEEPLWRAAFNLVKAKYTGEAINQDLYRQVLMKANGATRK